MPFRRASRALLLAALLLCAAPVSAQDAGPDYLDDRSTPESVLRSLYNAVERQEYLRAWSYFRDEPDRPAFESFAKGYEGTAHVRVRLGTGASDGAAGSVFYAVPAMVEAKSAGGETTVFAGCHVLRLVQPAAQATPPFQPLNIVKGVLKPSGQPFDAAEGSCVGLP